MWALLQSTTKLIVIISINIIIIIFFLSSVKDPLLFSHKKCFRKVL